MSFSSFFVVSSAVASASSDSCTVYTYRIISKRPFRPAHLATVPQMSELGVLEMLDRTAQHVPNRGSTVKNGHMVILPVSAD